MKKIQGKSCKIIYHIYIPDYILRNKMNVLAEKQNRMHYTDFFIKKKYSHVIVRRNACFLYKVPFQSSLLYNTFILFIASSFYPNGSSTYC